MRWMRKLCLPTQFCGLSEDQICTATNNTEFIPKFPGVKLEACSNFTCCQDSDCNTYVEVPPTPPPTCTNLASYFTSPWATNMSLCGSSCCGSSNSKIWQNRTCTATRVGACNGVQVAQEVACKDTGCNKLHCAPHYFTSPWVTNMSACGSKCCGSTPSQIGQSRSCFGKCDGVKLTQEIECEKTHCNSLHCGASTMIFNPLYILIITMLSIWA